jgi:hypothetical protein
MSKGKEKIEDEKIVETFAKEALSDQPESRRAFIGKVGKFIAMSALSCFILLTGMANATEKSSDACSNGVPPPDLCNKNDPDYCPGGMKPEDLCMPEANRKDDWSRRGSTSRHVP